MIAHEDYGAVNARIYGIRPDGYIGLRTSSLNLEEVTHYYGGFLIADRRIEEVSTEVTEPVAA